MARNGGVLKIPASATQPRPAMPSVAGTHSTPRLKLLIRRLPPGLTDVEFEAALGEGWQVGNGKVDWASYKPGKVSKDPTTPSKPSRAYLNLTKQEYISLLSDTVRETKFSDARNSFKDPSLRGPPSVEFAPYGKTPRTRARKDARQGTIDQDPEFIEFLESLTNPVPKPASVDQQTTAAEKGKEKVMTTPLIQFLKDKKSNKGKENIPAAAAKGAKHTRQGSKDPPSSSNSGTDKSSPLKPVTTTGQTSDKRSAQAIMVEKAARDAARVLNKQVASSTKPQSPSPAPAAPTIPPSAAASTPLAEKKRERGSASAAASILRRDLGIGMSPGARGDRRGLPVGQNRPTPTNATKVPSATTVQADITKATDKSTANIQSISSNTTTASSTPTTPATPGQSLQTVQPPTGPAASRAPGKAPAPTSSPASTPPKPNPTPSTATQAFLKHANPSQGITEPVLEEAFKTFGPVKRVEIDRKKGSAYVDFEEPEGLQKAIKASPVKVAQGQVVVLERRIGPNPQVRNPRGGPMMNNRGGMDGRGGLVNQRGDMRGGMVNNRGGIPMGPMGGRGGVRGRGGFVRGRGNMPNAVNARSAASTTAQPAKPVQEGNSATAADVAANKDVASSAPAPSNEGATATSTPAVEGPAAVGDES
ncbi:MAG: hypothetical protein Q9170_008261 [Blastenia crenularia]